MGDIHILIADDEKEIRDLLKKYLERECYKVDTALNGEEALRLFHDNNYNLAILDLMMPVMDGLEVCRRMREVSNIPIVMLTAKDQELEKILGLSMGADDYMTKPFSVHELVARIKAQLRRFLVLGSEGRSASEETPIRFNRLMVDVKKHLVKKGEEEIVLTAKEFELLKFFVSHPGQVFTKTQLFRQVWDSQYIEDDNTVMVYIRKLRLKIEDDPSQPKFIQTVWGIGYKFAGDSE
ncbi:response regulator transcription factor [Paenibacillus oenotherae]|uniref:Response regulator transcription factor n=1 Tax=Paenibacillus oenotherae TaxID=1435645 RepID=A0ABS7D647_9BACL|nr:response regulator transcription factor [Paenibacillus oenotherae]MBW7475409.1 response regulator transcription factor [Paenibacillus oenotherae]